MTTCIYLAIIVYHHKFSNFALRTNEKITTRNIHEEDYDCVRFRGQKYIVDIEIATLACNGDYGTINLLR